MVKNMTNAKKGFTIIEVVLVLAIAGLIFLMVFVAFPALQRNRSDTQRRQDYSDLASNIMNEAGNTNGKVLDAAAADGSSKGLDPTKYVNSEGKDPSGALYGTANADGTASKIEVIKFNNAPSKTPEKAGDVYVYYKNVKCGDDGVTPVSGGTIRSFVVYGFMESGNGLYCVANDY